MTRRRGFTLIELLVVIAIIGVLAGILVPVLGALQRKARRALVRNLVGQAGTACESFRADHGQYPWAKPAAATAATAIRGEEVYAELRASAGATVNTAQDYLGAAPAQCVRKVAGRDRLADVWGADLVFRVNPNGGGAVIWSRGPNGIDDTNFEDPAGTYTKYAPPPPPAAYGDPLKYPRAYYYLGDGRSRSDDLSNL